MASDTIQIFRWFNIIRMDIAQMIFGAELSMEAVFRERSRNARESAEKIHTFDVQ